MNVTVNMSNKKEAERTNVEYEAKTELRTGLQQEQNYAANKTLNETRDNIRRTLDEARREIPRNTQAVSDYQEHNLQAAREITDSYLESQREIILSFQSTWALKERLYQSSRIRMMHSGIIGLLHGGQLKGQLKYTQKQ